MRKFIQKISHPIIKKATGLYFSKPWKYSYQNITVTVHPDVFPPKFTISTKILLDYVNGLDLKNQHFLELGCGTGIISLLATSKGAKVMATDINETALTYLRKSAQENNLKLEIIHSDLFSNIEKTDFDYIIINPPYYPKKPKNIKEQAWFCGEDFEYFKKLFLQLSVREDKNVLMILSQDCQIETIKNIAKKNSLTMTLIYEKTVVKEKNFIYKVEHI